MTHHPTVEKDPVVLATRPDTYDPATLPDGWTEGQRSYMAGVMHQHGVKLMRSADGDVLPFEEQDDLGRWEEHRVAQDEAECRARCAVDRKYRREIRAIQAADRLGRSFFDPVTDVDMARAATLPPVTARRTAPRRRGAGRPAGRPAARASASSGDSGDSDSDPDSRRGAPHLPVVIVRASDPAAGDGAVARTFERILAARRPGTTWTVSS